MTDAWTFKVCDTLDDDAAALPPVSIGGDAGGVDFHIIATGPQTVRFDARYLAIDTPFRKAAIVWYDWFVFGFGERAILVSLDLQKQIEISLGIYFETFTEDADFLLIASGQGIVRLEPQGTIVWRNDDLGIDGVLIHDIEDGIIEGDGEWDPPGGWRPFRISLATGKDA